MILYEMLTGELLQGTSHLRIAQIHPNLAALDRLIEWMSWQLPRDSAISFSEIPYGADRSSGRLWSLGVLQGIFRFINESQVSEERPGAPGKLASQRFTPA